MSSGHKIYLAHICPRDILNKCPKHKCIVCYIVLYLLSKYMYETYINADNCLKYQR